MLKLLQIRKLINTFEVMKVTIYISNYNIIGGVERFVLNFIKRMSKHYDITLLYDNVDTFQQLIDASKYADVEKIDKSKIHDCDVFICSSAWGLEPYNYVNAKKYIQVVHADYSYYIKGWNFKYTKHPKTTHHVCVGKTVADAFKVATPYKSDAVIFNLTDNEVKAIPKQKNNKLHLVTISRISPEKGFERMLQLSKLIPVDYEWHVWGNTKTSYANSIIPKFPKNVKFHGVTTNPYNEIAKADYLVQLSDTEGYCYSVIESLQMATPCLITPFASGNEQIKNKMNGYIIDFELKNINFDEIINNIPIVEPYKDKSTEQDWIKLIES